MSFEPKAISPESVMAALQKAERYRIINDPSSAESICLDVLAVDPENQQALVTLLLAITDQFHQGPTEGVHRARQVLARLGDERRARDTLFKMALAHHLAFDFEQAEEAYDEAFCCRVEDLPRPEPTERIETASPPPDDVTPGDVYTSEGGQFISHLFQGLLVVDRELNVIPAMADNMRVSSDGLTYLFRIREDARWSDGEPVEADDFLYAWESIRKEEAITAFLMEDIESAKALDGRTIEVRLREPRSYFPYILAATWAFPRPKHRCEELGDAWRLPENLVSNGPFMLGELSTDGATLIANPHWSGPRGNVKEIAITFTARGEELVEEWIDGRFDVLQVLDPRARDAPDTISELVPELSFNYVGFRPDQGPFSNELVRKAFVHAIDREAARPERVGLVTAATKGGAIPPAMPGHSHRVALPYDPELARQLLADAGYPDGKGLPPLTIVASTWSEFADRLAEQWAEVLNARVEVKPTKKHLWSTDLGDAEMWLSGWTADYPDPDGFFRGLFYATRWPFYLDEEIEGLLDRARSLQNQGERMKLYHELDRLWVHDHAAILPLFYGRTTVVRRPWIEGIWTTPLTRLQLDEAIVHPRDRQTEPEREPEPAAAAAQQARVRGPEPDF